MERQFIISNYHKEGMAMGKRYIHKLWHKWCVFCEASEGMEQIALIGLIVLISTVQLVASVLFWKSVVGFLMALTFTVVSAKVLAAVWDEYKSQKP